ncbi:MAG: hypothetical protein AAF184_01915 [Pseudomonadota bacterium]
MSTRRQGRWVEATPADPQRAEQRRAQVTTPPEQAIPGDGNPPLETEALEPPAALTVAGERLIEARPALEHEVDDIAGEDVAVADVAGEDPSPDTLSEED